MSKITIIILLLSTILMNGCDSSPSEPYFKFILSGRITDLEGHPLHGINVVLYEISGSGGCVISSNLIAGAYTDMIGYWKIDYDFPVALAKYNLQIFLLDINMGDDVNESYGYDWVSLDLNKTEDGDCDFYCGRYEQRDISAELAPPYGVAKLAPNMLCKN